MTVHHDFYIKLLGMPDMQDCARLAEVTQRCSYKLSDCVLTQLLTKLLIGLNRPLSWIAG